MSCVVWRSTVSCLQGQTHQQVFWFYVSVDNIETVQVLDGAGQVEEHAAGISLCVFVGGDDCIKEIAALETVKRYVTDATGDRWNDWFLKYLHQLHDEVKLTVSINLFNQKHNVGMFHTSEDGHLTLNHVLLDNTGNSVTQRTREFHQTRVNISMPTFPLHLFLLMTFRAYSLPVDLSTHSRTTAKFPSPKVLPTLYLSAMETGTEEGSSISSAVEKHRIRLGR